MKQMIFAVSAVLAGSMTGWAKEKKMTKAEGVATFAGGCFWCMQPPFDKLKGVTSTVVGYTGGTKKNPTYEEVCEGNTGHLEAIQVKFDPSQASYERILDVFWRQIDPTDAEGQFCDKGHSYLSAIFVQDETQKKAAQESKGKLEKSGRYGGKKIATEILPAGDFWPAEEYHQMYYKKNPVRYKFYRFNCGRDKFLEKIWGKSDH